MDLRVSFFLHRGQHLVTCMALRMHSRQKMCPHVVAVMAFMGPRHIAHSRFANPPLFSFSPLLLLLLLFPLSLSLLLSLFVLVEEGDVEVVVVVVRWLSRWEAEEEEVEEEREDLTPMISSSSGLMGDPMSRGTSSGLEKKLFRWSRSDSSRTTVESSSALGERGRKKTILVFCKQNNPLHQISCYTAN